MISNHIKLLHEIFEQKTLFENVCIEFLIEYNTLSFNIISLAKNNVPQDLYSSRRGVYGLARA